MGEFGTVGLKILAVVILLVLNGIFVAVEFALVSLRRSRIDQLALEGKPAAKLVQRQMDNTDRVLAAAQLGITMASLGLGWIGEPAIAEQIDKLLPQSMPLEVIHGISFAITFSMITSLHIVLGEQVPKIYSIRNPEIVSMFLVRLMFVFQIIFYPFTWLLDRASQFFLRLVGIRGEMSEPGSLHSLEELRVYFIDVYQKGLLSRQQEEMLHSVIEFTELEAKEVMTPRPELISLEENEKIGDLLYASKDSGHSRFPIYRESHENIVGYLSIRDVINLITEDAEVLDLPVKNYAHPISYVPENKRISALFNEMQRERVPMVAVLNEFSDVEGIVTLNGLAEEIVGQLEDEVGETEPLFERVDRNTIRVEGQLRVDEANDELGLKLPERDEYQTIAGFLLYELQRVPAEGDTLRHAHIRLVVDNMEGPPYREDSDTGALIHSNSRCCFLMIDVG